VLAAVGEKEDGAAVRQPLAAKLALLLTGRGVCELARRVGPEIDEPEMTAAAVGGGVGDFDEDTVAIRRETRLGDGTHVAQILVGREVARGRGSGRKGCKVQGSQQRATGHRAHGGSIPPVRIRRSDSAQRQAYRRAWHST